VVLIGLMALSCTSFGSKKLVSSHTAYNDAVQLTVTREVLANIVRSRYSDPIQFIAVSTINAQFSVNAGGSAGIGGVGQGAAGQGAASLGYSDSPTITYVPQSDAAFYKSFYGAFGVGEAVGLGLAYRFAEADPEWKALSLRFSFAVINGASDFAGGKYNQVYEARIKAFARLLEIGASFRLIPEWDFDTTTIPKEKVTSEDMVRAFRMGLNFIEQNDGKEVRLARYRLVLALSLPDPDDPRVIDALGDLGVAPGRPAYVLRPPEHSSPGETDPYSIWVTPRSMADAVNLAARFVDVPGTHAGIVPALEPMDAESPGTPVVRIRSSEKEPAFPYRVRHRGYWFYVDDTDLESRVFLEGMVAAYSSRIGWKQAGDEAPQAVLPVGG
jgi:hypothetical protein